MSHGPDCWRDSSSDTELSVRALRCDGAVVKRNHIFVCKYFLEKKKTI